MTPSVTPSATPAVTPAVTMPTAFLDNRRTPCAVGLIRAAQRMLELEPGMRLEIWSRDVFAPVEIPLWAGRDGYRVVSQTRAGTWPRRYHVFVVAR